METSKTFKAFTSKKHLLIQALFVGSQRPTTLVIPDYETFKIWHENEKDNIVQFSVASVDGIYVDE